MRTHQKYFCLHSSRWQRSLRIFCSSPILLPPMAGRRSSPATSACCEPDLQMHASFGIRTATSGWKTGWRRCRSGCFMLRSTFARQRPREGSSAWNCSLTFWRLQVGANTELARRAVLLCKADLSTGIVGEFPELQGIMGHYYALNDGENRVVADAIAEHYKPLGPQDSCPTGPVSVVVALADKIDTLVALFATGDRPTGSRDPFGLRRAALGLIRLILENTLRLPLAEAFETAAKALYPDFESPPPDATLVERARLPWQEQLPAIPAEVIIAERLKVHLREQGVRHDLIAAVFAKVGRGRGRSRPPARPGRCASRLSCLRRTGRIC